MNKRTFRKSSFFLIVFDKILHLDTKIGYYNVIIVCIIDIDLQFCLTEEDLQGHLSLLGSLTKLFAVLHNSLNKKLRN